jgi:cell division protein FtsB
VKRVRQVSIQKRHQKKRKSPVSFMFILATGLVLWNIFSPFGIIRLYYLHEEAQTLKETNRQKEEYNASLRLEIEKIRNDPEVQEEYVRSRLHWIKDNEILYRF